jgi:hypothetical protein
VTSQDRFTFVTGGARSGKSTFAEKLAAQLAEPLGDRVTYLATSETNDVEMAARVAAHRAARPAAWTTVECPLEVPAAVREHAGPGARGRLRRLRRPGRPSRLPPRLRHVLDHQSAVRGWRLRRQRAARGGLQLRQGPAAG